MDSDPNPGQESGNFYNLSFFNSSNLGFESKTFLLQFFVDIFPLGSGYVVPYIFADRIQEAKILRIHRIRIRILSTATRAHFVV